MLVVMMLVIRCHCLPQDVGMQFGHVWSIRANCRDVSPLLPPFTRGQELRGEEWTGTRSTHEYNVRTSYMVLQYSCIFAVFTAHNTDFQLFVPHVRPFVTVYLAHELLCAVERAIHNINMVYCLSLQYECKPYMPVSLSPCAKDCD
jgi:hypothetical protein